MKQFETLDIATADMAFAAYGKTKDEMFENSAKALFSIMFEKSKEKADVTKEIKKQQKDDIILLHDFLSELLYLFDTEHLIFTDFEVKITEDKMKAVVKGKKYNPKKDKFIIDVKAITYHKMNIEKIKDGYKCVVIVDV